jgi:hypothetical protein
LRSPHGTGETPALHPARETRVRPFHGFWVPARRDGRLLCEDSSPSWLNPG